MRKVTGILLLAVLVAILVYCVFQKKKGKADFYHDRLNSSFPENQRFMHPVLAYQSARGYITPANLGDPLRIATIAGPISTDSAGYLDGRPSGLEFFGYNSGEGNAGSDYRLKKKAYDVTNQGPMAGKPLGFPIPQNSLKTLPNYLRSNDYSRPGYRSDVTQVPQGFSPHYGRNDQYPQQIGSGGSCGSIGSTKSCYEYYGNENSNPEGVREDYRYGRSGYASGGWPFETSKSGFRDYNTYNAPSYKQYPNIFGNTSWTYNMAVHRPSGRAIPFYSSVKNRGLHRGAPLISRNEVATGWEKAGLCISKDETNSHLLNLYRRPIVPLQDLWQYSVQDKNGFIIPLTQTYLEDGDLVSDIKGKPGLWKVNIYYKDKYVWV